MRALVATVVLAGCGFQPSTASVANIDAPEPTDAPAFRDAHVFMDAKIFMDAAPHGDLTVVRTIVPDGDLNLTSEGTLDWAHWEGNTGFDHKATGNGAISNATLVNGAARIAIGGVTLTASWLDGTPTATAAQNTNGTATSAGGLQITAPAGAATHTLVLYLGLRNCTARLDVGLSDASATPYSDQVTATTPAHYSYALTYDAAHAGQTITATWTDVGNTAASQDFAMLFSATLH